jgi:hypothetical protein
VIGLTFVLFIQDAYSVNSQLTSQGELREAMVQPHIDEDYIPGEASSLLGPGWKQVQEDDWVKYDNDEEYEDVEEEVRSISAAGGLLLTSFTNQLYVTMDLGNHLMPTVLMKAEECQLVVGESPIRIYYIIILTFLLSRVWIHQRRGSR